MMEPHIDSRTITLLTPGGLSSDVTVRALSALQLFEYNTFIFDLVCVCNECVGVFISGWY